MKARILDVDALHAVTPAALGAFARAQGWSKTADYADKADVYSRSDAPDLLIPRHSRLGDYAAVVSRIVTTFSNSMDADELAVYRDLICADRDVIRVRATDGVDDGAIDLDGGVRLISQAKDLLLSAACAARNPQPYYRTGSNKDATDYLQRVKLGQTEHGSFVVTLLSPVPPQLQPELDPSWAPLDQEPMERAVTRRLMDGLLHARSAVEMSVSGQTDAFDEAVSHGVSANLCEALSGLIDVSDGLGISITWARTRPAPEPLSKIAFSKTDAEILREAARIFRLKEPRIDTTLYGMVTTLKREERQDKGVVTVKAMIDDRIQSVSVQLDDKPYRDALDANGNKTPVILRGDLERLGSRWQMVRATLATVRDDDEDEETRNPLPNF